MMSGIQMTSITIMQRCIYSVLIRHFSLNLGYSIYIKAM